IHVAFYLRVAMGFSSLSGFGVCWLRIRRRHPGCRDLVATGWSSPSCSEGDAPVVAFWLPVFLAVVCALVGRRSSWRFPGGVSCVPTPDCYLCNPFLGAVRGGTGVCSSLTSWRVRGSWWFCLWDLNLEEVWGSRGCDSGLMWLLRCSESFFSRRVRAEGCFRIVFDSAGSAGVVSGPTLVVSRGITPFRCFVVLCSRSVGGGANFGVPGGGPGGRVITVVASFPAGFKCELQKSVVAIAGCACYERGCWFTRAAIEFVSQSKVSLPRWLSPCCWGVYCVGCVFGLACLCVVVHYALLIVNSGELLLEFFSVGSGGSEDYPVLASVCCYATSGSEVCCPFGWCVLAGFPRAVPWWFWWRFSQDLLATALGVLVEVLHRAALCQVVVPLTMCLAVVLARWFASLLAPYVLSQMVEEACGVSSSSVFCGLLGLVVLYHGFWCHVAHRGDLRGEGPFPLSCLELELVALLVHVVSLWAIGHGDLLCRLLLCRFLDAWLDDVGQRALCALEVLISVWCVPLSAYVVEAMPCVCVLLRADVVVALLKLLIFMRFSCVSLVESPLQLALCRFGAGVAYSTLLGLRFLACGFWQVGELPPFFSGILERGGTGELVAEQWSGVVESRQVSCRDTRQKVTCNLSRSGGGRLVVAFPSALQFLFPIVAEDGSCPSWALPSDEERDGSIHRVLNLKVTPFVSLSGCDRIHVAFFLRVTTGFSSPSGFGVCWLRIRRRHPGRRDLVVTGWWSPSCSEGDALVVALWLPVFLAVVCALVG
ncbi:hypothetical protein Taro_045500, partial [Colocasia esculenta]|nr:hypothetical protein [Colocasia esculenta]